MRIGSLFAGYGGLDMAVEQAFPGARPAWFCEWDGAPSKILAHHWPDVPNYRDVTAVDWSAVEPVDIIAGGFPCQDVSHAGRRQGLIRDGDGKTRSGLWGEMLKAIDTIRPPLVVAENVRGLLSAEADSDVEPCPFCMGDGGASPMRALGAVLADLADIGYDAAWCGLQAADVGAAHGRFRVFILAWPAADTDRDPRGRPADIRGLARPGENDPQTGAVTLLPTPVVKDMGASYTPDEWDEWAARMKAAHGNGNGHGKSLSVEARRLLPTPMASGTTIHTGGNLTLEGAVEGVSPQDIERFRRAGRRVRVEDILPAARESDGDGSGDASLLPTPTTDDASNLTRNSGAFQSLTRSINELALLPTPRTSDTNGPGVHGTGGPDLRTVIGLLPTPDAAMGERGPRSESALAAGNRQTNLNDLPRLTWGDYAPAIARWERVLGRAAPAPTEPGPKGDPRLSPRFVEWLMGLPAGHVTDPAIGLSRNQQLKALGNGVVPAQGAAALEWLLSVEAVTA